jgi:hypothetical protein
MRKKKPIVQFTWLLIFTTITVVIWVGLEIYRAANKSTVVLVLQEQLEPLEGSLDLDTIATLKQRRLISTQELAQTPEIVSFEVKTASPEGELKVGEIENEQTF